MLKRKVLYRWICLGILLLLSSGVVLADESLYTKYQNSQIEVYQPLDLVLHMFAHLEAKGSPASLYDPEYIRWIQDQKQEFGEEPIDLIEELALFQQHLEEDMDLFKLNFFPIYYGSTKHMIYGLQYVETGSKLSKSMSEMEKHLARYMRDSFSKEQREVVGDFAEVALNEYESFYQDYWEGQEERYREGMERFKAVWASDGYEVIEEFFAHYGKKKIHIYLSEGLRRNGRGFGSSEPNLIQSAAKLPETAEEAYYSYTIALHEMIHQISDPIVTQMSNFNPNQRSIDPSNQEGIQLHHMLEMGVVYAQYWLMQEISPEMEQIYLGLVSDFLYPVSTQQEFEEAIDLPDELKVALKEAVVSALQ